MVGPVRERRTEDNLAPTTTLTPPQALPRVSQGDVVQTIQRFTDLDRAIRNDLDNFTRVIEASCLDPSDVRSSFRETLRRLQTVPLVANRFDSIRSSINQMIEGASANPTDRTRLREIHESVSRLGLVVRFESNFLLHPSPNGVTEAESFAYFASLEGAIFDRTQRGASILRAASVYDTLSVLDGFAYCPRSASATRLEAFRFVLSRSENSPLSESQMRSDNDRLSQMESICARAVSSATTATRSQMLALPALFRSSITTNPGSRSAIDSMQATFTDLQGQFVSDVSDSASLLSYLSRFQVFLSSVHHNLYPDLTPTEFASRLNGTSLEAIAIGRSIETLMRVDGSTGVGSIRWYATNASTFLSSGNLQLAALSVTVGLLLESGVSIPSNLLEQSRLAISGNTVSQSELSSLRLSFDTLYADHALSPIERLIRRNPNLPNRTLLVSCDSAIREAINRGNPAFAYSLLPAISDLFSLSRSSPGGRFVGSGVLILALNSALSGDMSQFNSLYSDFVSIHFAVSTMTSEVARSSRLVNSSDSAYLSRIVRAISVSLDSTDPLVREQGFAAYSALSPVLDYLRLSGEFSIAPRPLSPMLTKVWAISQSSSASERTRLLDELSTDLSSNVSQIVSATSRSIASRLRDPSHSVQIDTLIDRIQTLTDSENPRENQLGFSILNLALVLSRNYPSLTRSEKDQCLHSLLVLSDSSPTSSDFLSTYHTTTSSIQTILTRALNRSQIISQSQNMLAALDGRSRFSPNLPNGTVPLSGGSILISELREVESPITSTLPPDPTLSALFNDSNRTRIINPPQFAVSFESLQQAYQRSSQSGRREDLQAANSLFSTFVEERLAERQRRSALSMLGSVSSTLATSYVSLRQNFQTVLQTLNIPFDERTLGSMGIRAFIDSLAPASRSRIPTPVLNAYLHFEQELESLNSRALALLSSPNFNSSDLAARQNFFGEISALRTQTLAHLEHSSELRSLSSAFCLVSSRRSATSSYISVLTTRAGPIVQTALMNLRIANREYDDSNSALLRAFDLFASGAPSDQIRIQKDLALAKYSEGVSRTSSAMASYMVRYPEDDGRSFYIPIPDYEPGPYRPGPGGSGPFNINVPTGTEVINLTETYFGTWNSSNTSLMRTALFGSSEVPRTQAQLDSSRRTQTDQIHALNAIELAIFGVDPYRWTQTITGVGSTRQYGITQRDLLRDLRDGNYRFAQQFATELVARARENEQNVQAVASLSLFALGFVPYVGLPLSILGGSAMLYENAAREYRATGTLSPTTIAFIGTFAATSLFAGAVGALGRMRTAGISSFNALSTSTERIAALQNLSRLEQVYVASGYGLYGAMGVGSALGVYATLSELGSSSSFSENTNLFLSLIPLGIGARPALRFMRATRTNPFSTVLSQIGSPIPIDPVQLTPGSGYTIETNSQTATRPSRGVPIRVAEPTPLIPEIDVSALPANDNAIPQSGTLNPTSIFDMLRSMIGASLAELRAIRDANPALYDVLSSLRRDPNVARAIRSGVMDQNTVAIIGAALESSGLAPSQRAIAASGETPTLQRVDARGRLIAIDPQTGSVVASANNNGATSGTTPTPNAPTPTQNPTPAPTRVQRARAWVGDRIAGRAAPPEQSPLPTTTTEATGIINSEFSGIFDSLLRRVRLGGDQVFSDVTSLILECDRLATSAPQSERSNYLNLRNELIYALETNPTFSTAMQDANHPLHSIRQELQTLGRGNVRPPNFSTLNPNLLTEVFSGVARNENITGQDPFVQRFDSVFGVTSSPTAQGALIALRRIAGCDPVNLHGNYLSGAVREISDVNVPSESSGSGFEQVRSRMAERVQSWSINPPEEAYGASSLFDSTLRENTTSNAVANILYRRISTTSDSRATIAANRTLADSFGGQLRSGNTFDALSSILPDGDFKTQFQTYRDLFANGRIAEIQGVISETIANNQQNTSLVSRLQFISDFLITRASLTSDPISTSLASAEPLRRVVRETSANVEATVARNVEVNVSGRYRPMSERFAGTGDRISGTVSTAVNYIPPVRWVRAYSARRRGRTLDGSVWTNREASTPQERRSAFGTVVLFGLGFGAYSLYMHYSSQSTADADTISEVQRMLGAQLNPANTRLVRQTTGLVTPRAVPIAARTDSQRDLVTNGLAFLAGQYTSIPQSRLVATNQAEVISCMSANNSPNALYPNPYTMNASTNAFVAFLGRVQTYSRSGVRGGTGLVPLLHDLDTVNLRSPTSDQFQRIRTMIGSNVSNQTVIDFVMVAREIKLRSGTLDATALYTLFTAAVLVPNGWAITERQLSIYTFLHRSGFTHAQIGAHLNSLSNNPLFFASIFEHVKSGAVPLSLLPQLLSDSAMTHAIPPRAPGASDTQYYDAASAYYLLQFRSRGFISPLIIRRNSLFQSIDELQARHSGEFGSIFQNVIGNRSSTFFDPATPTENRNRTIEELNNLNMFEVRDNERIIGDHLVVRFLALLVMNPNAEFSTIQNELGSSVGRRGAELQSLYDQLVPQGQDRSIAFILNRARSIGLILPSEIVSMYPGIINRNAHPSPNAPTNAQMAQFLATHTNDADGLVPWLIRNRSHLPNVPGIINAFMASSVRVVGSGVSRTESFESGPIGSATGASSSRLFASAAADAAQSTTNPRGLDSYVVSANLASRNLWSGPLPVLTGPRQTVTAAPTTASEIQRIVNSTDSPRSLPTNVTATPSTSITPVAIQAQNRTSIDLSIFTPAEVASINQGNLPFRIILLNRESFAADVLSLPLVIRELATRAMVQTSDNGGDWANPLSSLTPPTSESLNNVFATIFGAIQQYYVEYEKSNHGQALEIQRRLGNLGITFTREPATSPTIRVTFDVVAPNRSDGSTATDFNLYPNTQYWADYVRDNARAVARTNR